MTVMIGAAWHQLPHSLAMCIAWCQKLPLYMSAAAGMALKAAALHFWGGASWQTY